jgi:hypothetical protein
MGGGVRQDEEAGTPPGLVPAVVVKGKRSKRQRVHAPPAVLTAAAEWSSSSAAEEDSAGTSPSAASAGTGCVTEEEEDMALCLMMLSRGEPATVAREDVHKDGGEVAAAVAVKEAPRFRSRRPADGAAGAGEFVYECKTCNKCFPSFQALGGHRTSHKKPRLIPPSSDDKSDPAAVDSVPLSQETPDAKAVAIPSVPVAPKQESGAAAVSTATSTSRHPRVHECSICGAEFASGQALGGHMRRHRPLAPATTTSRGDDDAAPAPRTKEKSLLELDLNLPAPCDEGAVTSPRFGFTVAERQPAAGVAMLFPAALVDCHY